VKLAWRPRAIGDLFELRAYIAEQNPPAASFIAARIGTAVIILAVIHAARKWPERL
jgi:plasmid stabilization system protein ParE